MAKKWQRKFGSGEAARAPNKGAFRRWLARQFERRTWDERAAADPTGFLTDGFIRPSIGVVGGWILGGLFALVVWLTFEWAPEAAERARQAPDALGDAITPEGGWAAIIIVAALALAAGWEQAIEGWLDGARRSRRRAELAARRRGRGAGSRLIRGFFTTLRVGWAAIRFLARIPSRVISVADWALAKVFACAAGAHRISYAARYLALFGWIFLAFLAGLFLTPGAPLLAQIGLPDKTALILMCFVMVAIIGVARRWAWIEQDRDAFLITRTEEPLPSGLFGDDAPIPVRRVGFRVDLRDEALTGLVSLFALIPLALMQIELLAPGSFDFTPAPDRPLSLLGRTLDPNWTLKSVFGAVSSDNPLSWYSYFGAELAKSVPFVDWSEVFHVPNGTPISPATPTGASVVFGLRAGLDLLVLAAVLQAISIAGRMRQVRAAFTGRLIDVLDPFDERLYFRRAESRRVDSPGAREIDQPGIIGFAPLDRARLLKRASGRDDPTRPGRRNRAAQRAMMAVAARQVGATRDQRAVAHDQDEREAAKGAEKTRSEEKTLSNGAKEPRLADAVEALGERLERARNAKLQRHALELFGELGVLTEGQRQRLGAAAAVALKDKKRRLSVRISAARELGRLRAKDAADALAAAAFAENEGELGAAATVALAKLGDPRAARLAEAFPKQGLLGAMRAHAFDLLDNGARLALPRMARVPGGDFLMGAAGSDDPEADDGPQHHRRIGAFSLGRTQTRFAEYDAFCDADGRTRPEDGGWGRVDQPAVNVSWQEAQEYLRWLRLVTGERWRLPSEAEWEYACRGGAATDYAFGDDPARLGEFGWFIANSGDRAHPVAGRAPNGFGLYDMHGNVWEWCQDQWRSGYRGAPHDSSAWISWRDTAVRRGGSWYDPATACRASDRFWARRSHRNVTVGFRVACSVIA